MSSTWLKFRNPVRDAISKIQFAPQSNNLLISSWDSCLRLYDVGDSLLRLESSSDAALLDCCFENESVALTAGSDGFIRRHDLHTGMNNTIGKHDDIATCVTASDEECHVVTAGCDKKIKLWDVRQAEGLVFMRSFPDEVGPITISGFDLVVCIGASVDTYDLRSLERPSHSSESPVEVQIRCISSVPHLRGYAVGSVDARVALEVPNSSTSREMRYAFRCHPKSKNGRSYLAPVNDIEFNPVVSGVFVTGDQNGYVTAWHAQSRRRLFEFPRYSNSISSLSFNHKGKLLAVASSYTYQEANEIEEPPQIYIHPMDTRAFC